MNNPDQILRDRGLVSDAAAKATAQPIQAAKEPELPGLRRILKPEAAGRWLLPSLSAITPQYIEGVLRNAMAGSHVEQWELFDLMKDSWPRLAKCCNEVKQAVQAMDWRIEAWAEDNEAPSEEAEQRKKVVSNAVWGMRPCPDEDENDFRGVIADIMDAWFKGVSVQEIDWTTRRAGQLGDITVPRATWFVPPAHFGWSSEGWLGLRHSAARFAAGQTDYTRFLDNKFIIAKSKAKSGHPLSSALLRPLAWWWCAANFSSDWLLNLAQVFGLPFRWANFDPNASKETVDRICTMLENMGSNGWAAMPAGTTMELKEASSSGGASPQDSMLDRAEKQCDLLILGQTLTTDVGDSGSRALGNVHAGVRSGVIDAAATFVAGVLNNQLVPAILTLNYGDDGECPWFDPKPEQQEDEQANALRDKTLLEAGLEIPRDWLYERHGVPIPQAGEDVVKKSGGMGLEGMGFQPRMNTDGHGSRSPLPTEPQPEEGKDDQAPQLKAALANVETTLDQRVQRLGEARAEDLQPLRKRLARLLQIRDPEILRDRMLALRDELPQLLRDMNADPAQARELESALTSQMALGLTRQLPDNDA